MQPVLNFLPTQVSKIQISDFSFSSKKFEILLIYNLTNKYTHEKVD